MPDRPIREGVDGGSVFLNEGFGNFVQTTPERRQELRDKVRREAEGELKNFFWYACNITRNSKYIEESASAHHRFATRLKRLNGEMKIGVDKAIQTYINGGNVDEFLQRIKTTDNFVHNLQKDIRRYKA